MKEQNTSVNGSAYGRKISSGELLQEAKRQSEALKMIGRWRTIGFVVSAIGAVLLYGGITRAQNNIPLMAAGAVIAAAGLIAAIVCDLGIRNGRRNVEKILQAAEHTPVQKKNSDR